MHPWTMHQLNEQRSQELLQEMRCARAVREARLARRCGSAVVNRKATRYLGELLIRTGWRLVGPDAPASGMRPRLALRAPGSMVDSC